MERMQIVWETEPPPDREAWERAITDGLREAGKYIDGTVRMRVLPDGRVKCCMPQHPTGYVQ